MISIGYPRVFLRAARRFLRDRKGASAIEFAFVVPLLLVMYLGTMELGQGIETNKKVARSASMIGDLITQEQSLTKAEIDGILIVGESILQPYYRSRPIIIVTAVRLDTASPPIARVAWRRKIVNGATSGTGATTEQVQVPVQLRVADSFLVKVETELDYKPVLTWREDMSSFGYSSVFTNIPMKEVYYLRARQSADVACSDC